MQNESSQNRNQSTLYHLTDEEVALCAQELAMGSFSAKIPAHIQSHLADCHKCYTNVQDLCQLIYDEPRLVKAIRAEKELSVIANKQYKAGKSGLFILHTSKHRWLYAAAAVLFLLALSVFSLFQSATTPEELFSQYYAPYHDVITSKSTVNNQELLNGLFYYNIGDYRQAINLFNQGLQHNPNDHDLLFYLAGSHLAIGEYKRAIAIYELLHFVSLQYYSPVRWYLALSYLAGNKTAEASEMLESIRDEGGFYAEDAGEILRKLK